MAFSLIRKCSKNRALVAVGTANMAQPLKHGLTCTLPMTTEEAMALIEGALDYCRQRQKVLTSGDRDADALAIDHEFKEWLNPQGGILPLMPCPKPESS